MRGCTAVQYLDIPKSVTAIGDGAFANMEKLQSLGLFTAVQVSAGIFDGCTSLTDIRISGYDSNYSVVGGVLFSANGETLIFYPAGLQQQSYRVPAKVKRLMQDAFAGRS